MKQQFVSNHTISESDIFALRDNWVTNITSVKIFLHKNFFSHIFIKESFYQQIGRKF